MIPTIRYQTQAPPVRFLSLRQATFAGLDWISGEARIHQRRQEARKEKTERRFCCCCGHMPDWYVAATHQSGILPKPLHVSSPQNSTNTEETHTNLPNNTTQLHSTRLQLQPKQVVDPTPNNHAHQPCLEHPGSGHLCGCRCLHAGPPFITSSRCRR